MTWQISLQDEQFADPLIGGEVDAGGGHGLDQGGSESPVQGPRPLHPHHGKDAGPHVGVGRSDTKALSASSPSYEKGKRIARII